MRIPDRILNIVEKQLDADCGISADRGNTVTTENKTVICRAPRFPEKRYLTDAAYGELLRERMEKESGNEPRVYEGQDLFFRGIVCMGRVRILAAQEIFGWCVKEFGTLKHPEWLCQFSGLRRLDQLLSRYGRKIEDVRLNFLPSGETPEEIPEGRLPFELRWLEEGELVDRRDLRAFRHAVCGSGLTPDVLAAAALLDGRIVGMAGATRDGGLLRQIGVDVDEAQRGKGMAAALVGILKNEILRRGEIPFYGVSQSHILSMNTAVSAGFLPAWTEIYAAASTKTER